MKELIIVFISVAFFSIIIYMVCGIWFRGKKSTYLKLFFAIGILFSFWELFNGINVLMTEEQYRVAYPLIMIMAGILPPLLLRYFLHFTESRFAESRVVIWILTISPAIDLAMLLTNPWHNEFISSYEGIRPIPGKLFPFHAVLSYAPILIGMVLLTVYIIRNIRKTPSLAFIGAGIAVPMILNILYTFNIFDLGVDITPFAFLLMFSVFTVYSIRLRLFNVKEAAVNSIFNSLNDATLVVDNAGFVTDANPSFRRAFPGLKLKFDKTMVKDVVRHFEIVTSEKTPENVFALLRTPEQAFKKAEITVSNEGQTFFFELTKDIIYERGQYAGFALTITDVSSYRKMIDEINLKNEKLTELKDLAESASHAKGIFLANMSHEIRTPLNAILGMTEIARGSSDMDRVSDCLGKINAASKLLLGIINDVLDMSKIESNKYGLNVSSFLFMGMIENIVAINSDRIAAKALHFSVNTDKSIPRAIISDELRLSQVINNLLSNAVKFTPSGGHIEFTVEMLWRDADSAWLIFSVRDDGIGISEEKIPILFNAFEQADLGISRKFGGTGLGLAISQSIVELLGGTIQVESVPNEGSRFFFGISVGVPEDQPEEDDTGDNHDGIMSREDYDFSGYTILLAEDVEINREIILALMESTGVTIDCAENGQAALDMYAANPEKYDLIFMDIQMPLLDGYSVTKAIRELDSPLAKAVPVIAMTANAFSEDVERAKQCTMIDHIPKPIDSNVLMMKTNRYIRQLKNNPQDW